MEKSVDIVYCTECKYYRKHPSMAAEDAVVCWCEVENFPHTKPIPDGWYCKGGERKNEQK